MEFKNALKSFGRVVVAAIGESILKAEHSDAKKIISDIKKDSIEFYIVKENEVINFEMKNDDKKPT